MSYPAAAATAVGGFPPHAHARASPTSNGGASSSTKFRVRRIPFPPHTRPRPVLMQAGNGPCPLLALVNILLLRGHLNVGPYAEEVSEAALLQALANRALELEAKRDQGRLAAAGPTSTAAAAAAGAGTAAAAATVRANKRWHIGELLELLPCLAEGLDVNVRFDGPEAFESTAALTAFDALGVRLLHGWLLDPQDRLTARALLAPAADSGRTAATYNQAVDQLIAYRALLEEHDAVGNPAAVPTSSLALPSPADDVAARWRRRLLRDGPVIEEWLRSTAGQLTVYGLATLHEQVQEGELAAFFRANHFSVLHKRGGRLFVLATDEGFLSLDTEGGHQGPVWERLDEPTGDVGYVDGHFRPLFERQLQLQEQAPAQAPAQGRWGLEAAAGGASYPSSAGAAAAGFGAPLSPPPPPTPAPAATAAAALAAAPSPPPPPRFPAAEAADRLLALQLERDQDEAAREGRRAFAAEGVAALLEEGGPLELLRARDPGAVLPSPPVPVPAPAAAAAATRAAGREGEDGGVVEGGFYLVPSSSAGGGGMGAGEGSLLVDPETRRPFTPEEVAAMRAAEEGFRRAKEARAEVEGAAADEAASEGEAEQADVSKQQHRGDDGGRRGHRAGGQKACVVQ